ncbi:ABC transporter permease [Alkalilimnicola ehrlichii]|uniref:FecCD family ABC transporter permease n=1 Tax=Alkalilimnicola ehrlichii TaxID=351052 RepID=UPI000E2E594F|nr:iron ABC transporter permease [Alkalilimnicola ehrlichii]RFA26835.1 ABC transporter permease [Alkalilimnicola ehrlichii]
MTLARAILSLLVLAVLGALSLLLSLAVGSISIPFAELPGILTGSGTGLYDAVVWELRLPRALTAFVTGALLALAGALMQVLLRNPLADPYVLGVSGGAAVAALTAIMLGLTGIWISGGAFFGALFSMFLVFGLAHGQGSWTPARLLLTGVVVAAGWGALISFLLAVSPDQSLRGMLFWLMGDLSGATGPGWSSLVLLIGLTIAMTIARSLNLLARGDLQAQVLGVAVARLRLVLFFLASLLAASAVTLAGSVGFIGLVVPHLLRLVIGGDHRLLLPSAVLLGGTLLMLADTLARTIIAPQQLPVGVLSAMIGVPVFLFLLHRGPQAKQQT